MSSSSAPDRDENVADAQASLQAEIRRYETRAIAGLWLLALFLGLSLAAYGGFPLFPSLPENVRAALGASPPTGLISLALVVYSFSAIILLLARQGSEPSLRGGFAHLGYLTGFYLFYQYGGQLTDNFLAVFASGLTILGLYSYQTWSFFSAQAKETSERLALARRRQSFFSDEVGTRHPLDTDERLP
jgi:hypothetical protein